MSGCDTGSWIPASSGKDDKSSLTNIYSPFSSSNAYEALVRTIDASQKSSPQVIIMVCSLSLSIRPFQNPLFFLLFLSRARTGSLDGKLTTTNLNSSAD